MIAWPWQWYGTGPTMTESEFESRQAAAAARGEVGGDRRPDHPGPRTGGRAMTAWTIERDPGAYVTEIAVTPEPRELQVMHSPMPEPELDEPEA